MFSPERFGSQPRWLVLDALDRGKKRALTDLHNMELPIAWLHHSLLAVNGDNKTKVEDLCLYIERDDTSQKVSESAANAYWSLRRDGKIPSWAIFFHKELMAAKTDISPPKFRCLDGDGFIILAPSVRGDTLSCPIILCQHHVSRQAVRATDPDTGRFWVVQMPRLDEEGGGVTALGDEDLKILHSGG